MTEQELGKVMKLLEKYYKNFYAGMNKEEVFAAWYPLFKDDDAKAVERAVVEVVCTLRFPPTVADIKTQMAEDRLEDQMTPLEAFQKISEAVDNADGRMMAGVAFNELPPILRKIVGNPSQLISWRHVSEETFHTVIMSAIRSSYEILAKREVKYYALPEGVRKAAGWRIEGKEMVALPEPKETRTLDDLLDDMDRETAEYREREGMVKNEAYNDRVAEFLKPVTKEDIARVEFREQQKGNNGTEV